MKNIFMYDSFPYSEVVALFNYFKKKDCHFYSCLELGKLPLPRGVSFRYDIHVRDILGAYSFVAAHYRYNVPGTFYLLAQYSNDEYKYLEDFMSLSRRIKPPLEIGLHDSPVDSYLLNHKFNGIAINYWRWLQSDRSLQWFTSLSESETDCVRFHEEVMEAFSRRVLWMKKQFGAFRTMASHGGEINQMFRKRVPELGKTGEFITSLFAENWATEQRLAQVGLEADVEQFRKKAPFLYQVTDGGGLIKRMTQNAETFIQRGRAEQILIHPYTWAGPLVATGGQRDGELSVLLGGVAEQGELGGRKSWQRLLRTRWMKVPKASKLAPFVRAGNKSPAQPPPCFLIISATSKDIASDVKVAGFASSFARALIVEAEANLPEYLGEANITPLFDYLAESESNCHLLNVKCGRSVHRYGPLISGAIECLTRRQDIDQKNVEDSQQALAQWMLGNLTTQPYKLPVVVPKLERKELSYFLFSSSQRSNIVKRIVDNFFGNQSISCFVDHGAGIGMISLCTHFACNNRIKRVVCSEIKHNFVDVGVNLWKSLGYGNIIEYQECSSVDFVYPGSVTVVLFAQMLYRIEPNERQGLINSAWNALEPGGLLIINELLDREDTMVSSKLLTSEELKAYLPKSCECWLFWGGAEKISPIRLNDADNKAFRRADNFIVVRKPSTIS